MTTFDPARAKVFLDELRKEDDPYGHNAEACELLEAACAEVERLKAEKLKAVHEVDRIYQESIAQMTPMILQDAKAREEAESLLSLALEVGLKECVELRAWIDVLEKDEHGPVCGFPPNEDADEMVSRIVAENRPSRTSSRRLYTKTENELRAALREAVEVMRAYEFSSSDYTGSSAECPSCGGFPEHHESDCRLAAAIARAESALR